MNVADLICVQPQQSRFFQVAQVDRMNVEILAIELDGMISFLRGSNRKSWSSTILIPGVICLSHLIPSNPTILMGISSLEIKKWSDVACSHGVNCVIKHDLSKIESSNYLNLLQWSNVPRSERDNGGLFGLFV